MQFNGGVKAAAKMLSALPTADRLRILADIAKQDPQRAELLKREMVVFEDLLYLTVKMLVELLREINLDDLALALRIASPELRSHILGNVSKSIRLELEDVLNGKPRPVSEVEQCLEKIMDVVRRKVEKGELVLSANSEEMV
ncbi:hypothetical protein A9Q84_02380 [Halobacteriovorax marinus]|uniref:Flagellar motor switch protein FliG C-terminal domain-containing protein n=1 Tax=Halobacteriovorax marinus TaxID=97084 RepID=A0A1Y5FGK7_9BACT|nr:hypothetical protein A9Q84_02380 [Halobacteriovorax marinus]